MHLSALHSDEESNGGGSHGRRRLPLGHIRAVLSRARANTWEVRSMHGLAAAVMQALGIEGAAGTRTVPDKPGAKRQRSVRPVQPTNNGRNVHE